MTTNSPNPVGGDVQALISLCKIEIKRWKVASETNPNMRYMVTLMETALASLTADPVAYVHPAYLQPGALGFDASVGRLAPAQVELYTAPPAQLLRQQGYEVKS